MGYYSRAQGYISFFPGVTRIEALDNPVLSRFLEFSGQDVSVVISASLGDAFDTIECPFEDEFKAYHIESELKELIQALGNRTYTGYIEIQGEGDGIGDIDIRRLKVEDGTVVTVQPKLVWPED